MRHIHTGRSGNHPTATICCYPNVLEEPAIVTSFGFPGGELSYFGEGDVSAAADLKAVAQFSITLRRFPLKQRDFLGALVTEDTVFVSVTYPMGADVLKLAMHSAVVRALTRLGVERQSLRSENNDVLVQTGSEWKKVFGEFTVQGERFNTCAGFTTFEFNVQAARDIYNLQTRKFTNKGDVRDIGELVCGLRDVHPGISMMAYRDLIVELLAGRLDENVVDSSFTPKEKAALDDVLSRVQDKDWIERGRWRK